MDEPDIYLHSDLQKKIYKYVKKYANQLILATHSIDIISEVNYNSILQIDKKKKIQKYSKNLETVQNIVSNMGDLQNIALMKMGRYSKCIFVEGLDKKLLGKFLDILYLDNTISISDLPIVELGSFSRFNEALGAARLFYENTKNTFKTYCILDRDYHTEEKLNEINQKATENHLELHIWQRKEIENYVINIDVLYRLTGKIEDKSKFEENLNDYLDIFYDVVFDNYASSYCKNNKSIEVSTANKLAREKLSKDWNSLSNKIKLINGKQLVTAIIKYMKKNYNINLTKYSILKEFTKDDIPSEVIEVLKKII